MTSRNLRRFNMQIDILYHVQLGDTLAGIANSLHISHQLCGQLYKQAKTDPRICQATELRQRYHQLTELCQFLP